MKYNVRNAQKNLKQMMHRGLMNVKNPNFDRGLPFKEYLLQPFNLKEKLQNIGREEYFSLAHVLDEEIMTPGRLMLAENKEDMEMIDLIKGVADSLNIRGISILDRKGIETLEPLMR